MSGTKKAAKSVVVLIIFTLGSRLLGLIRESLIAAKFGSSAESDVFFIALTAISLISLFITQAINKTMIPILSEVERIDGIEGKKKRSSNLLNIIMLFSIIIMVISWFLSPYIIKVIAHGFKEEQYQTAVLLLRIGLPAIFFSGIVGVFRGYLQSEMAFTESATSQLPVNIINIAYLVLFAGAFGITGLMAASVVATASQIIVQLPGIRKTGFRYNLLIDLKDKYVTKMLSLMLPVLVTSSITDINKIIDRTLASTLVEGSISALNYGEKLKSLFLGVFITAITTVIFPMLSKEAQKDRYDGFKNLINTGINTITLISMPVTVGMIVLAEPLVRVVFQRGAFDANAASMTTGALVFYTLGLVPMALKSLLNQVYYSLKDTKAAMRNAILAVGLNIVLNLILVQFMAHRGLALATSIASFVTTYLLISGLKKRIGQINIRELTSCFTKSLGASLIMGLVVFFFYRMLNSVISGSFISDLIVLAITVCIGAGVYFALIYLFRVKEFFWCINIVKSKLRKQN